MNTYVILNGMHIEFTTNSLAEANFWASISSYTVIERMSCSHVIPKEFIA